MLLSDINFIIPQPFEDYNEHVRGYCENIIIMPYF